MRRHPQCRLYLTSRIAGYEPLNLDAKEWELVSFSPKQIEGFVHNFFSTPAAQNPGPEPAQEERRQKGAALLQVLRQTPQVMGLARIPLLLALLCRLFWQKQELPQRRVEIYEQVLWGLLWEWRKDDSRDHPIQAKVLVQQGLSLLADLALQLFYDSLQDAWDLAELIEQVIDRCTVSLTPPLRAPFALSPSPSSGQATRSEVEGRAVMGNRFEV